MYFQTERLIARPWTLDDADVEAAFQMYGDLEVMRYLGRDGAGNVVKDVDEQRERLAAAIERYATKPELKDWFVAPLEEKATGQIVGTSLLKPLPDGDDNLTEDIEIGWHLARAHWGKGYATEAAQAALDYGFERNGAKEIHAVVYTENARSIAVMHRLGMRHLGKTSKYYGVEAEHFLLTRDAWREIRSQANGSVSR